MTKKKTKNLFGKLIIVLLIIGLIVGGISGKYWYLNYKVINIVVFIFTLCHSLFQ